MSYAPINLKEKLAKFSDQWSPKVVAEMNEVQFKLSKLEGEFVWHAHEDTDELFLVVAGELVLEFRDGTVTLGEGDLFVVPKGVEHKPVAREECHVLVVEPRGTVNTGTASERAAAPNDVWV